MQSNKTVQEVAKDIGMDVAALLVRLNEMGVEADEKTLLSGEEIAKVDSKLSAKCEIVEKRVRPTIIRRRVKKIEKEPEPEKPVEVTEEGEKSEEKPEEKPEEKAAEKVAEPEKLAEVVREEPEAVKDEEKVEAIKEAEPAEKPEVTPAAETEKEKKPDKDIIREVTIARETETPRKKPVASEVKRPFIGKKKHGRRRRRNQEFEFNRKKAARDRAATFTRPLMKTEITETKASKKVIRMEEAISVGDLAQKMGIKGNEIIKKLMELGTIATINQLIDLDAASLIAQEYEYGVEKTSLDIDEAIEESEDALEDLVPRAPAVTVMGHVDHGKTSLLDIIRETNVTSGEAGGITQHIGAYHVHLEKGDITFLDTPGHEAFTAMRARGAKLTDIVVLVVAANDGVMPQTVEAVNHSKAANVPIIVAVNKMDLPEANPDKVKQELSEHGLVPEDWGGDTIFAEVSAKAKTGIKELLELILLQAEVLELKTNTKKSARGVVVESRIDKGKGPVATVLVQQGTLKVNDAFITGLRHGRVRALINDLGEKVNEAGPSIPVEVLGLSDVPDSGDSFIVVDSEAVAKQIAELRLKKERSEELLKTSKISLDDLYDKIQSGDVKELNVVVKGDVQGSVEAVVDALAKVGTSEVKVNVIHSSTGGVSESDVILASASNAIIIAFNVRANVKAQEMVEKEGVDMRFYTVIYDLVEEVKKALEGLLEPIIKEEALGTAEVRETFTIPKIGTIAGCYVTKGKLLRACKVRLLRDSVIIYNGNLSSLKRFKDDVKEVSSGYECGLGIENYNDLKVGDQIEAYKEVEIAAKL